MTNKETTKDVRGDLISKLDDIRGILTKLERIEFLLGELLEDYSFSEKPNPLLLLDDKIPSESHEQKRQTQKWFWEYNRIQSFIEMASEYASNSREDTERTLTDLKTLWNVR